LVQSANKKQKKKTVDKRLTLLVGRRAFFSIIGVVAVGALAILVDNFKIYGNIMLLFKRIKYKFGTIYEKKANNSGRQLDEVVKFRHFSSNEAAYR